jgi:2-methylcitrate dehydratase PrpD
MGKTEERIAEFVVKTAAAEIPAASYAAVQRAVLDCIGCMLAGAAQPHGQIITRHARDEGGSGPCTVVGTGIKTSRSMAALANGTLGHALDFDDGGGFGHASVVLLPPALAVGEALGVSGRELLTAYILGFEVGAGLARGARYVQGARGFHSTPVFGALAATAVAARLLGLNQGQTVLALGIAGSMPSGVLQNFGTYTKPLHAGMTARGAVVAARLAQDGWTACDNIVESRAGWASSYIGAGNYDPAAMVAELGTKWASSEKLGIKRFPCCQSIHLGLNSLLSLMDEYGFTAADVERLEVAGLPAHSHVLFYPHPSNAFQGKFSIHYSLATALVDGQLDVDSYVPEKLERPEFAEALQKIDVKVTSNWDTAYAALPGETPLRVQLKDGRVLTRSTGRHSMYGMPANPLTDDDLQAKFRLNAQLTLSSDEAEQALSCWSRLGELPNLRAALETVSAPARDLEPAGQA